MGAAAEGAAPSVTIAYTLPDTTAPTISIAAPATNALYTQGTAVDASYSCADEPGGSWLALCAAPVPSGSPIDTSTPGARSFTVTAVDRAGNSTSQTVSYLVTAPVPVPAPRVAPSAPSISIASPLATHRYTFGRPVPVRFTCADGAGGAGIQSCTGTVRNGGLLDTSRIGRHTFTVTATSKDGLKTAQSVSYTVVAPGGSGLVYVLDSPSGSWPFQRLLSVHPQERRCSRVGTLRACTTTAATVTLQGFVSLTGGSTLKTWRKDARLHKQRARTSATLDVLDKTGKSKFSYALKAAWPTKLTLHARSLSGLQVYTVTLTLTAAQLEKNAS